MKIAVTSIGETIESPIDQRFGRARYFLVHDTETGAWSVHSNRQNLEILQGAGIQAAQAIIDLKAAVLITGHCGPKAFRTLSAGKIEVYQNAEGTVKEAIGTFLAGNLNKAENPNVAGHFGKG